MDRADTRDDDSPGRMLDALKSHPEWSDRDRDAHLGRAVERFPADRLMAAVLPRLSDLSGPDAEALVRLVEANPAPAHLEALARALEAQPGLPPDRAWEALALLDSAGLLDAFPDLAERWDELNEGLDDEGSIDELVEQIEEDHEGLSLALEGLAAVEPEIRAEILAGLAGRPLGPGLKEFFRRLAGDDDEPTRAIARAALDASRPPDTLPAKVATPGLPDRPGPRLLRSLVSAVDGRGRATIVLASRNGAAYATAAFLCDVGAGVLEVAGELSATAEQADAAWDRAAARVGPEPVAGAHPLALGLLGGALWLNQKQAPPSVAPWVEATAGGLTPAPFLASFPDWSPDEAPLDDLPARVEELLNACPDWLDDSPLTAELAEEIALRERGAPPDPKRDAGAYRYLFEHRLGGRLELYRRMLLWMAWFWRGHGRQTLSRTALALAWQLSDAQHVVPGHPFTVALATRSLSAAASRRGQRRFV